MFDISKLDSLKDALTEDQLQMFEEEMKNSWSFDSVEEFYREFLFRSISHETFRDNGIKTIYLACGQIKSLIVISDNEDNYKRKDEEKRIDIKLYSLSIYGQSLEFQSSLIESIFVGQGLLLVKDENSLDETMAFKLMEDKEFVGIMQNAGRVVGPEDGQA